MTVSKEKWSSKANKVGDITEGVRRIRAADVAIKTYKANAKPLVDQSSLVALLPCALYILEEVKATSSVP